MLLSRAIGQVLARGVFRLEAESEDSAGLDRSFLFSCFLSIVLARIISFVLRITYTLYPSSSSPHLSLPETGEPARRGCARRMSAPSPAAAPNTGEEKKRKDVEFFEEDDEFEEFVSADWDETKEDAQDERLWQDDWDDDDAEDDFCRHLREELAKSSSPPEQAPSK